MIYNLNVISLNNIMLGSEDAKSLAAFYEKILGRKPDMEDGGWYGWQIGSAFLSMGDHSEVKGKSKEPQRVIFNFESNEVKEEFERMKSAGAIVIKEPYGIEDSWIATLSDPDGNYFQLMSPWDGEASTKN